MSEVIFGEVLGQNVVSWTIGTSSTLTVQSRTMSWMAYIRVGLDQTVPNRFREENGKQFLVGANANVLWAHDSRSFVFLFRQSSLRSVVHSSDFLRATAKGQAVAKALSGRGGRRPSVCNMSMGVRALTMIDPPLNATSPLVHIVCCLAAQTDWHLFKKKITKHGWCVGTD